MFAIKNSSHNHKLWLDAISTKKFLDFIYHSNFNIHNHNSPSKNFEMKKCLFGNEILIIFNYHKET